MDAIIPQGDTPKKHCSRCKELKPRTSEYFGASRRTPDGFRNCCKACRHIEREKALIRNPSLYKDRYQKQLQSPERTAKHRESGAAYAQKIRERNRLAGLCIECGKRPHTNGRVCDECRKTAYKRYRGKSEYYLAQAKKSRDKLRNEVLEAYGGKCTCCGESIPEFLAVDHINNDGAKHRRTVGSGFYQWLRKNGYPQDGFQLLCHNCNFAKSHYEGGCPHQRN